MFPIEPTSFAVLVVHRDSRASATPQADHIVRSSAERRWYPPRRLLVPASILLKVLAESVTFSRSL